MSSKFLSAGSIAGLLLFVGCTAGWAQEVHKATVEESAGKRITRPAVLQATANASALSGTVNDNLLQGQAEDATAAPLQSNLEDWNPWGQQPRRASFDVYGGRVAGNAAQASAIDYDAIEQAYANAVPPLPVPLSTGATTGGVVSPVVMGLMTGGLQVRGTVNIGGVVMPNVVVNPAAHVDVDNCDCGRPMPTPSCMSARTSAIYGSHYSGMHYSRGGGHR